MKIIIKRSHEGAGVNIDSRGKEIPTITLRDGSELEEGNDYVIEEKDKPGISAIVFEWLNNQTIYFLNWSLKRAATKK